jgi:probable HAF family extracellular repeat protein
LSANAINNLGQIAGFGAHNGQTRAFLMTPIAQ